MKNLFDLFEAHGKEIDTGHLLLFFDYDGTLTPITDRPKDAALSLPMRDMLKEAAGDPSITVCIISGRSLQDIKALVGLSSLGYIGNHGLEAMVPGFDFHAFDFGLSKQVIYFLKGEIEKAVGNYHGVIIEDKGIILSVHYRLVAEDKQQQVLQMLNNIVAPFVLKGEVKIASGKKVFEIHPPLQWHKGEAVRWLMGAYEEKHHQKPVVIYVGDDRTDEDAFGVLATEGITVKVGAGLSLAQYQVEGHHDVMVFLREILNRRKRGTYGS